MNSVRRAAGLVSIVGLLVGPAMTTAAPVGAAFTAGCSPGQVIVPANAHAPTHGSAADALRVDAPGSAATAPAGKPTLEPVAEVIQVHWHVITGVDGVRGDMSEERIQNQIRILNAAFSGEARFGLASIDRTADEAWFTMAAGSPEEAAAKAALHEGSADDLNVYSADSGGSWGEFPWDYARDPSGDGIVLHHATVPVLDSPLVALGYVRTEGKIAVHEAGHWLGLLHTFHGGCGKQQGKNWVGGDLVDDTPAQATPTYGDCPEGADTCPAAPGTDPIHNYMDYSSGPCQTEFTPGQYARMDAMWQRYRAGK